MKDLGIIAAQNEHNRARYSQAFLLNNSETEAMQQHLDVIPIKTNGIVEGLLPQNLPVSFLDKGFIAGEVCKARRSGANRWEVEYSLREEAYPQRDVRPGGVALFPKLHFVFDRTEGHAGVLSVTPYVSIQWSVESDKPYLNNTFLPGGFKWAFTEVLDHFLERCSLDTRNVGCVNSHYANWEGINFAPLNYSTCLYTTLEHLARNLSINDLKRVEFLREQLYGRDGILGKLGGGEADDGVRSQIQAGICGLHAQAVRDIAERIERTEKAPSKLLRSSQKPSPLLVDG